MNKVFGAGNDMPVKHEADARASQTFGKRTRADSFVRVLSATAAVIPLSPPLLEKHGDGYGWTPYTVQL